MALKEVLSVVFPGNDLRWNLILLLIFHYQSHIWQNFGSRVNGQNAVGQSNYRWSSIPKFPKIASL